MHKAWKAESIKEESKEMAEALLFQTLPATVLGDSQVCNSNSRVSDTSGLFGHLHLMHKLRHRLSHILA